MRGASVFAARGARGTRPSAPERAARHELVLATQGLSVAHGEHEVVRDVDVEVRAGELVALVGPNGAGKSTLLAALTGDLGASGGRVRCFDRDLHDWSTHELARRRAVLPQQVTVSFPFTVREVVRMGRAPWARTTEVEHDDEVVEHAIEQVDLTHLAHRPFPSLSGGERARAALARVLAQRTQLVLLDEPTAALDLHHQELVFGLLAQQVASGAAVVVVVHDLGLASAFADRVIVLERGRIAADGAPREVLTAGLLSRVYRHDVEVVTHPVDGSILVAPRRGPARPDPFPSTNPTIHHSEVTP